MRSADIRAKFLDFFAKRGHQVVPSASLVPQDDPSLLFTNSGMMPFKDSFLGLEKRSYKRATSAQRCVRAGGKHNDLENVGHTNRHHTFFEMLGNFSFGDYFKQEAIGYAWELLTQGYALPEDRLWITVHESDDEAADIWMREIGIAEERVIRLGDEDNYWSMGSVGPCGPCSEIFYDHGSQVPGGLPGSPEAEGDRYVEIWNLVFMQYQQKQDGSTEPLPNPSVDTGMGLERMAAVLQGVSSNYDTDLFQPLTVAAAECMGVDATDDAGLRVVADHIRSCAFLVADGVLPSNDGRGYVLRRIARRALRHGHKLGCTEPFFHRLVPVLAELMGDAYPELGARADQVSAVLLAEEEQFAKTLRQGMDILNEALASGEKVLAGETAFRLYDTYGFPVDLTADIAREQGVELDMPGYEAAMQQQRSRGRSSQAFNDGNLALSGLENLPATRFLGYEGTRSEGCKVAYTAEDEQTSVLQEGSEGVVVMEQTPFYAEAGGQVGDSGELRGEGVVFAVADTRKAGEQYLHLGKVLQGELQVGANLNAEVDAERRAAIARNHSATHLMHAALREVLGDQTEQKGSLVDAERLRFDFSASAPLTQEQILHIEELVNQQIIANTMVQTEEMPMQDALDRGAMALFGEKYAEDVRVLSMGEGFSVELCGGTHVARTGDIGLFALTGQGSIAAGVRRVEAITGLSALRWVQSNRASLQGIAEALGGAGDTALERVQALQEKLEQTQRELNESRRASMQQAGQQMLDDAVAVGECHYLVAQVADAVAAADMREQVDAALARLGSAVVVLASVDGAAVRIAVAVSEDCQDRVQAGAVVKDLARQLDGKGGGRAGFAQGGGSDADALPQALDDARAAIQKQLES